jgi:nucleoside-diphosphate-sugar epimerase
MAEIAAMLRELGPDAAKVPTRTLPNTLVRLVARFDPGLRSVIGDLGQRTDYCTDKAKKLLGWSPRPIEQTVHDTARGLLAGA